MSFKQQNLSMPFLLGYHEVFTIRRVDGEHTAQQSKDEKKTHKHLQTLKEKEQFGKRNFV